MERKGQVTIPCFNSVLFLLLHVSASSLRHSFPPSLLHYSPPLLFSTPSVRHSSTPVLIHSTSPLPFPFHASSSSLRLAYISPPLSLNYSSTPSTLSLFIPFLHSIHHYFTSLIPSTTLLLLHSTTSPLRHSPLHCSSTPPLCHSATLCSSTPPLHHSSTPPLLHSSNPLFLFSNSPLPHSFPSLLPPSLH